MVTEKTNGGNSTATSVHGLSAIGLLVTMGIVFGDIGTSPLYVMKTITAASCFLNSGTCLSADYVIGAVSCIIWTLTLQTTLKYVVIALRADNRGEGGILALYALLRKHKRKWLYLVAIVGASTLVADGVITPAITVVSAIEGLEHLSPGTPVVPISIAIIACIFFVQQFGTDSIGKMFGPFMLVWFLMIGALGAWHIPDNLMILKAFNPVYAVQLLASNPNWFLILGAVFLCTTGAEALYSDLGHCGRLNITVSWIYVKAMLILNYLGQGAWIIANVDNYDFSANPFYAIMPKGFLVIGVIMATGAAIIASQALISGCFTIFSEAINLKLWPRMRIKYPTHVRGQLYIPSINWFLLVFCVLTVLLFRTSSHMEAAYGLAITITMLMTTLLLSFYLRMCRVNKVLVVLFASVFLAIEGFFFVANMFKFMHGGWFTILIASAFVVVMYVWYNAMKIRREYMNFSRLKHYYGLISDLKADDTVPKFANNLVYINRANNEFDVEDKLIYSIVNKGPKRADHYWLFHFENVDEPNTLEYTVTTLIPDTLFSVNVRLGFRVQPYVNVYLRQVVDELKATGTFDLTSSFPSLRKHGIAGNFRFVLMHRIYYPASAKTNKERVLMSLYSIVKHIGISDAKAFGLDTSSVLIENVPLIIDHSSSIPMKKIQKQGLC